MGVNTRVTALLPAYQSAGFIRKTLDSLSQQTRENFDVIISVDLCEDDTYAICQEYCERFHNFRVTRQEKRLGYVGNCNYLLNQAEAEYVLFAFHDDVLDHSYVEKLCTILDERPEVVMCYSDVLLTRVTGEQVHWEYKVMDDLRDRVQRGRRMLDQVSYWWVPNRGIFRLDRARRIGGLKTHGAGEFSPDWPWLFHMSLLGEFVRVPETLCYKFYKKESLSRSWAYTSKQRYGVSLSCMRELLHSELTVSEKFLLAGPLAKKIVRHKIASSGLRK